MSSRRVASTSRYADRSTTPYDSPQPAARSFSGGLFSKIKSILSPVKKQSGTDEKSQLQNQPKQNGSSPSRSLYPSLSDGGHDFNGESSHEKSHAVKTPATPASKLSLLHTSTDRFNHGEPELSPNVQLAEFFKKKGSEPLTEIETEGVLSLIRKVHSPASSDPTVLSPPTINPVSFSPVQKSPIKLKTTPQRRSTIVPQENLVSTTPGYNPIYTSKPSPRRRTTSPEKRRSFKYSSIPSPYRISQKPQQISDKLELSPSKRRAVEDESNAHDSTKRLSQTASTLLALLENTDEKEEPKRKLSPKNAQKPLTNPYALSPVSRRDRKSTRRSLALHKSPSKQTPSRTEPKATSKAVSPISNTNSTNSNGSSSSNNDHNNNNSNSNNKSAPSPRSSGIQEVIRTLPHDKSKALSYKPARSSSLRKSFIPIPNEDKPNLKEHKELFKPHTTLEQKTPSRFRSKPLTTTHSTPALMAPQIPSLSTLDSPQFQPFDKTPPVAFSFKPTTTKVAFAPAPAPVEHSFIKPTTTIKNNSVGNGASVVKDVDDYVFPSVAHTGSDTIYDKTEVDFYKKEFVF